ncbi:hypothetical protein V1514DRAFT_329207 [Lipomyces japonicus]|uniref:uncharacterized protein n=1 Tax=Lipomyces japonicus TaxID=56871 RepID=UPI0034CEF0CD
MTGLKKTCMSKDELQNYLLQLENQTHGLKKKSYFNSKIESPQNCNQSCNLNVHDKQQKQSIMKFFGHERQHNLLHVSNHHRANANIRHEKFNHPPYEGSPAFTERSECDPTINRFKCEQCGLSLSQAKPIVKALGKLYHVQCFHCAHCGLLLEHVEFYPKNGKLYCHHDYNNFFSPRCKQCSMPIENEVITAMGATYHPEHFSCTGCNKLFSITDEYHSKDDHAWCRDCFMHMYASHCWKCNTTISEGEPIIKVLGKEWCADCFSCEVCKFAPNFELNSTCVCGTDINQCQFRNAPYRLMIMDSSLDMMDQLFA